MGSPKSEVLSLKSKARFLDFGLRTSDFGLVFLVVFLTSCATTSARKSPFDLAIESASKRCACRIGVEARHLESGRSYSYNADAEFESASVIKIAVLT